MFLTKDQEKRLMNNEKIVNIKCRCGFSRQNINRDEATKLYEAHKSIYCFPKLWVE